MKKILLLCICSIVLLGLSSSRSGAQSFMWQWQMPSSWCWALYDSGQVWVDGYTTSDSVVINFGDGSSVGFPPDWVFSSGDTAAYFYAHYYSAPGTYTVTVYLLSGGVPVDSFSYSRNATQCNTMDLSCYVDTNSNCTWDSGEHNIFSGPVQVKVDSAGVPVDTVTSNWGAQYPAYGPVGTVYTFTVITNPPGFLPACPTSGVRTFTVTSTPGPYYRDMGFECDPAACLDRSVLGVVAAGITGARTNMYITASSCTPVSTTATITFSPKYTPVSFFGGASHSVSGNVITFNITGLSATTPQLVKVRYSPVGTLTLGDTVQTTFSVSGTGDCNLPNNVVFTVDTIRASYDPNQKSVKPAGDIAAGTQLEYMLQFENLGNDTAHNVHLMDTLSDHLDISTIRQIASSAQCRMILLKWAGHNIVKFDFPNIKLLDSSHHPGREGFVAFTIKAKATLAPGTHIDNRAGIYFDSNPVVMTNNVRSTIGNPSLVSNVSNELVQIYPNPVNDELTIKAPVGAYQSVTVTNMLGQVLITRQFDNNHTAVNVKGLPAGIYYVTLRGDSGVKVQKFEKL